MDGEGCPQRTDRKPNHPQAGKIAPVSRKTGMGQEAKFPAFQERPVFTA
jgi:hypothetical protein